ncbi:MAG TPA: secondary thiamine-phosphate synthase enzyme YjbQ, partial [Tepidisphaeraceae bacterium]|nr:secondary thiamine-phosphate synthase enzyme YjbQ [Tepidisphaeraceae bacterium]
MKGQKITTESVHTTARTEMIDVTSRVQRATHSSGIRDGMAVIYVPHTTAAVTINENADPDVRHDLLKKLAELVPHHESYYRHSEGNSDSHVKTSLVGSSV